MPRKRLGKSSSTTSLKKRRPKSTPTLAKSHTAADLALQRVNLPRIGNFSVSLQLEKAEDFTPRTVEACKRNGLKMSDLLPKSDENSENRVPEVIKQIRQNWSEKQRLCLLHAVEKERKALIERNWQPSTLPQSTKSTVETEQRFFENEEDRVMKLRSTQSRIQEILSQRIKTEASQVVAQQDQHHQIVIEEAGKRYHQHIKSIKQRTHEKNEQQKQRSKQAREYVKQAEEQRRQKVLQKLKEMSAREEVVERELTSRRERIRARLQSVSDHYQKSQELREKEHKLSLQKQKALKEKEEKAQNLAELHKKTIVHQIRRKKSDQLKRVQANLEKVREQHLKKRNSLMESMNRVDSRVQEVEKMREQVKKSHKARSKTSQGRARKVVEEHEKEAEQKRLKLLERKRQEEARLEEVESAHQAEMMIRKEINRLQGLQVEKFKERKRRQEDYKRRLLEKRLQEREERINALKRAKQKAKTTHRKWSDRNRLMRAEITDKFGTLNLDALSNPKIVDSFAKLVQNPNDPIVPQALACINSPVKLKKIVDSQHAITKPL